MNLSLVTQNTSVAIPFQDDDINELDEVFYVSLMVVGDYDHALVQIHRDSTLTKECKIRDDDGKIAGLNLVTGNILCLHYDLLLCHIMFTFTL